MRKSVPVPNAFLAEGFDLKPRQTILKVRLKLATPMIGGGAESGHPDEHWPIRPTAIRGHLRFWWRAVEGFRHDPAEMRKREIELFGGINPGEDDKEKHGDNQKGSTESKISLSVKLLRDSAPVHVNTLDSIPAYVKNIMTQGGAKVLAIKDCTFIVEISSNQQLSDEEMDSLRRSVLAWIRYGGIGARTRRGAGSLQFLSLEKGNLPTALLPIDPAQQLKPLSEIPMLFGARQWTCRYGRNSAADAWLDAINLYQTIRKGKPPAWYMEQFRPESETERGYHTYIEDGKAFTFPQKGEESHSTWPERASISDIQRGSTDPQAFPRALFGLPIQFRFTGNARPNPRDTELTFIDSGRFGSPLIVKAIKGKNSQWHGCLLLLNAPLLDPRSLKLKNADAFSNFTLSFDDLLRKMFSHKTLNNALMQQNPLMMFLDHYIKQLVVPKGDEWEREWTGGTHKCPQS